MTRAPHLHRSSTPVSVRFSDFAGVPTIPDNHPEASPRGIAIRFHLAEHVHTDILAHSVDGFPARTAEEFVQFLRAIHESGPDAPKPSPIESFLASHPAALRFVQAPKPLPASFLKESFFSVSAYKFTGEDGMVLYGRYRILPDGPGEHLDSAAAAAVSPDFLFDEIRNRLSKGPAKIRIALQLAIQGDVVDDSTIQWPEDRPQVDFGTIQLESVLQDTDAQQQHLIFDPIPRVDGIEPSADPLFQPRADTYLISGRRRRKAQ